jgi:hypothetical protein
MNSACVTGHLVQVYRTGGLSAAIGRRQRHAMIGVARKAVFDECLTGGLQRAFRTRKPDAFSCPLLMDS